MHPIRSFILERCALLVLLIFLPSKIIPTYSLCAEKRLSYIVIIVSIGCQLLFYMECTCINMRSSYNIRLVFTTKCMFFYIHYGCLVFYLSYCKVLYNNYYGKA